MSEVDSYGWACVKNFLTCSVSLQSPQKFLSIVCNISFTYSLKRKWNFKNLTVSFAEVSSLFASPQKKYHTCENLQIWKSVKIAPIKLVSQNLLVNSKKISRVYYKLNFKSHYLIFEVTLKKEVHFCGYTENAFSKHFLFSRSLLTALRDMWEKSLSLFLISYCCWYILFYPHPK